jgi:hypothetical protein
VQLVVQVAILNLPEDAHTSFLEVTKVPLTPRVVVPREVAVRFHTLTNPRLQRGGEGGNTRGHHPPATETGGLAAQVVELGDTFGLRHGVSISYSNDTTHRSRRIDIIFLIGSVLSPPSSFLGLRLVIG